MIDMYNRTEDEIITIDNRNNSQVLNTEDYSNEEILETNESFISDSQEVGTDNILQTPLENDTQELYSKEEIDEAQSSFQVTGPNDMPRAGEVVGSMRSYTRQYLENKFSEGNPPPFPLTDENIDLLNREHAAIINKEFYSNSQFLGVADNARSAGRKYLHLLRTTDPEVDYTQDATWQIRSIVSGLDTHEERIKAIDDYYGEGSAGIDSSGRLTFMHPETGKKTTFDKPEFTATDWADFVDDYPMVAATIGTSVFLGPVSLGRMFLGDLVSYFTARTGMETYESLRGRNLESTEEILDRFETAALLTIPLFALSSGGVWFANRLKNPFHNGMTPKIMDRIKEVDRLNRQREARGLPKIQLPVSAMNESPFLGRIEGILSKLPITSWLYRVQKRRVETAIGEEVEFLLSESGLTGAALVAEREVVKKRMIKIAEEYRDDIFHSNNVRYSGINKYDGAESITDGVGVAYRVMDKKLEDRYVAISALAGDSKIIPVGPQSAFKKLLKKEMDDLENLRGTSPQFDRLYKELEGWMKLGNKTSNRISLPELFLVKKALSRKIAGKDEFFKDLDIGRAKKMYKALNTAVTRLTQHAERVAPYLDTPMSDAAIKAFTKEINNISLEYHKFNKMYLSGSGTVSDIVKASSAEDIVNFFMRKNNSQNVNEVKKILLSAPGGKRKWKKAQEAMQNELFVDSTGRWLRPTEIQKRLEGLGKPTVEAWMGKGSYDNYMNIAAMAKKLNRHPLQKITKNIEDATRLHKMVTSPNLTSTELLSLRNSFKGGKNSREWKSIQQYHMADIIERATVGGILDGKKLLSQLQKAKGGETELRSKIIFEGTDYHRKLYDLAEISVAAAKNEGGSVGGLAAGMAIMSMFSGNIAHIAGTLLTSWVAAGILTSKSVGLKWLTKEKFSDITNAQLRIIISDMNRIYFGDLDKSAPSQLQEDFSGFRKDVLKDAQDAYGDTSGRLKKLP